MHIILSKRVRAPDVYIILGKLGVQGLSGFKVTGDPGPRKPPKARSEQD